MHRLFLLLLVFLTSCSTWSEKSRAIKLEDLMNGYTRTMESSDFSRALLYRKYTAENPPPDLGHYSNIKIWEYRPVQMAPSTDGTTVLRIAQIRYILLSRMAERSLTTQEVWKYSEEDGRWYLTSDLPSFPR
jgi:hypothetical protein